MKKNKLKKDIWIMMALYFLAVVIRLYKLNDASIYSDEITWMVRGKELIYAIIHGNIGYFINGWWINRGITEAIALPLTFLSGLSQLIFAGQGKYGLKIFSDILAARLPGVVVSSLLPVVIYYFGSGLFSKKLSIFSALIYALNPISIGLDRSIINDSFLTLFSFTALVSYIYYSKKSKMNILPGFFLSLAFLTKPDGVLPLAGWIIYEVIKGRYKFSLRYFLINIATFAIVVTILWPSSWSKPIFSIFEYLFRQLTLVQQGMPVFYMGKVTSNPGYEFYLFQYLVRMPVILLIGFIGGIVFLIKHLIKKLKFDKETIVPLTVYSIVVLVLISISNKKLGIRYGLPILPFFVIVSTFGLISFFELIKNRYLKIIALTIITANLLSPLTYIPDYYLYYNFLVGGPKGAQRYDTVGFCASSRLAAEYLNNQKVKGGVYVAGCPYAFPYYSSLPLTENLSKANYIILETYFVNQHPEDAAVKYLQNKTSWKDIQVHGAIIAKIYKQG
jgi:4-amino-4-deoxy-L-arabinose transferase-like glycosyltransferase